MEECIIVTTDLEHASGDSIAVLEIESMSNVCPNFRGSLCNRGGSFKILLENVRMMMSQGLRCLEVHHLHQEVVFVQIFCLLLTLRNLSSNVIIGINRK